MQCVARANQIRARTGGRTCAEALDLWISLCRPLVDQRPAGRKDERGQPVRLGVSHRGQGQVYEPSACHPPYRARFAAH
jgi:hypothetical protein